MSEIQKLENQVKMYEDTIMYLYEKIENKHVCVLRDCQSQNVHLVYDFIKSLISNGNNCANLIIWKKINYSFVKANLR